MVLSNKHPFADLQENTTVFFVAKPIKKTILPPPTPTSALAPAPTPAPAPAKKPEAPLPTVRPAQPPQPVEAPCPTPAPARPPIAPVPAPTPAAPPQQETHALTIEQLIRTAFDGVGVDQIYDPQHSIWENPRAALELEHMLEEDPELTDVVLGDIASRYGPTLLHAGNLHQSDVTPLIGVLMQVEPGFESEINVQFQGMTNEQREGFRRVLEIVSVDPHTAFQLYVASDYNPDIAVSLIAQEAMRDDS